MSTDSPRPLGEWLRQRREELGISLEKAEADTRIRLSYLEALESGRFDALPDAVVGRGFLRNYATYLALDPKEAVDRFSKVVAPPEPESLSVDGPTPFTSEAFRPVPLHDVPGRRARWPWIVGLVLVLVVALGSLAWWYYPRVTGWFARQKAFSFLFAATATQQVAVVDLPTVTYTAAPTLTAKAITTAEPNSSTTPTPELTLTPTWTPSPSPTSSPPVYTGIFLELVFTDTSWIQVTVDGVREFQGELETGTYRSWYGEQRIELRLGNAGAVLVTINGQSLGTLGRVGDVVDRVFEKVGEEVTEATVTPAPTVDLTASPPPTIAPTLTITPTTPVSPTTPITPTTSP